MAIFECDSLLDHVVDRVLVLAPFTGSELRFA